MSEASQRRNWQRRRGEVRCRACLTRRCAHGHHVVAKGELKNRGLPLYDRRNRFEICQPCHFDHESGAKRIPLGLLTDEHIDYAFEVLGAYAYDYLHRYYVGDDPRLEWKLKEVEEAA